MSRKRTERREGFRVKSDGPLPNRSRKRIRENAGGTPITREANYTFSGAKVAKLFWICFQQTQIFKYPLGFTSSVTCLVGKPAGRYDLNYVLGITLKKSAAADDEQISTRRRETVVAQSPLGGQKQAQVYRLKTSGNHRNGIEWLFEIVDIDAEESSMKL